MRTTASPAQTQSASAGQRESPSTRSNVILADASGTEAETPIVMISSRSSGDGGATGFRELHVVAANRHNNKATYCIIACACRSRAVLDVSRERRAANRERQLLAQRAERVSPRTQRRHEETHGLGCMTAIRARVLVMSVVDDNDVA
jgi:hypothetical protein